MSSEKSIETSHSNAVELAKLAHQAGEEGDVTKQTTLYRQAAEAFGQTKDYKNLLTILGNLGIAAKEHNPQYLAQAVWLMLRIQPPLPQSINPIISLYHKVPKGDPLEALLGTTASFLCKTKGENHPQQQELQALSVRLLLSAAQEQGIDLEDKNAFQNWMAEQQLHEPSVFLPQLSIHLTALIGNSWVFDSAPLRKS